MKTISFKVPDKLHVKLERAARRLARCKSDIVRGALEQFLNGDHAAGRADSALELAGDLVGCVEGPGDLSTKPKYMEEFGQ
jgi:hypothetical protein